MARKRKKGSQNRQNAAGDSRVSVLTEDKDTYNPFKNIKEMDVVEKVKTSNSNINKNKISKKEDIVEKIDDGVSFADIFGQWEKGGVVNTSKQNKAQKMSEKPTEDFADIFNQWEVSQGIKSKYSKKVKENPNRKVSNYNPTKDFGQLLNQFENGTEIKNTKSEKFFNKQFNPSLNKANDEIINNKKNPNNLSKITKETFVADNIVSIKTEGDLDKSSNEPKMNKANVAWSSNDKVKNSSLKNNPKELEKTFKVEEKTVITDKYKNIVEGEKEETSSKNQPEKKHYEKYHNKASQNSDPKWDFSDIYSTWESKHDEAAIIEVTKLKEKKECKGISISYLRSMKPEDTLDLHGLTSDIASLKVSEFLTNSRNRGLKKVSIITGKGIHSENGKAILRDVALEEIRFSNIVREAYHPKAVNGGSGVIWVIFKSNSDKKIYF